MKRIALLLIVVIVCGCNSNPVESPIKEHTIEDGCVIEQADVALDTADIPNPFNEKDTL